MLFPRCYLVTEVRHSEQKQNMTLNHRKTPFDYATDRENTEGSENALNFAMSMPHLFLAESRSDLSLGKTLQRLLDAWLNNWNSLWRVKSASTARAFCSQRFSWFPTSVLYWHTTVKMWTYSKNCQKTALKFGASGGSKGYREHRREGTNACWRCATLNTPCWHPFESDNCSSWAMLYGNMIWTAVGKRQNRCSRSVSATERDHDNANHLIRKRGPAQVEGQH